MAHLTNRDLESLLRVLPDLYALHSLDSFPEHIVRAFPRLIAADSVAFNRVNLRDNRLAVHMRPTPADYGVDAFESRARAAMHDHPLITYEERTRDSRTLKLSDFVTRSQLSRLRSYNEALRPIRIEYLLAVANIVPNTDDHIALSLGRERTDFGERERQLMDLIRPHFVQAYLNARAVSRQRLAVDKSLQELGESSNAAIVLIQAAATYVSPRAEELLRKFFPRARTGGSPLPKPLEQWIRSAGRTGLCVHTRLGGPTARTDTSRFAW